MYCCTLPDSFSFVSCSAYIQTQTFASSNPHVELVFAANDVRSGMVCPLKTCAATIFTVGA